MAHIYYWHSVVFSEYTQCWPLTVKRNQRKHTALKQSIVRPPSACAPAPSSLKALEYNVQLQYGSLGPTTTSWSIDIYWFLEDHHHYIIYLFSHRQFHCNLGRAVPPPHLIPNKKPKPTTRPTRFREDWWRTRDREVRWLNHPSLKKTGSLVIDLRHNSSQRYGWKATLTDLKPATNRGLL